MRGLTKSPGAVPHFMRPLAFSAFAAAIFYPLTNIKIKMERSECIVEYALLETHNL